jgi:cellobiose-specific phosphotransferase system component IIC
LRCANEFSVSVHDCRDRAINYPLAGRLGQQKYVIAIRDGFTAALPFMIIGSFMLVFIFPPFSGYHQRFRPRLAGFLPAVSRTADAAV